jgi:hypothetical protein
MINTINQSVETDQGHSVLAQAARPKPINQDAHTVAAAPVVRRRA